VRVKIVRTGITRTVFLAGRYAIKVPSMRGLCERTMAGRLASMARGILANQRERQWHSYEGWDGLVAPVLHSWLGGLVQVYPRCEPLPDGFEGALPELDPNPGDIKPDNYGLLNGRIVRIDYDMA
jgi:hypothetical protein